MAITHKAINARWRKIANAEREAGGQVSVSYALPYVAIDRSDGERYFFQGEEAEDLLAQIPDWADDDFDCLLYLATGW